MTNKERVYIYSIYLKLNISKNYTRELIVLIIIGGILRSMT